MKKTISIFTVVMCVLFFYSCKNKTQQLLTKKWDCVKVDNLDLGNEPAAGLQDSINNQKIIAAMESLTWTFKDNHEYECSIAGRVTVQGSYGITEDGKTVVCTPSTKNSINSYYIQTLTENDLVLSSALLVLHFKPH